MANSFNDDSDLESVFQWIREGNQHLADEDWCRAAEQFGRAHEKLNDLALRAQSTDGDVDPERPKIVSLYHQQACDYLHRSRNAFLTMLRKETDQDKDTTDAEPAFRSLTEEEADRRLRLFVQLYGGNLEVSIVENVPGTKPIADQESSLADRLASLNASLPQGFKTSDQRMLDIDRGLNRLGLSLYSSRDERPKIEVPQSEEDQVASIIAQTKDEMRFQPPEAVSSIPAVEIDSSVDDSEDDEDDQSSATGESLSPEDRLAIQEIVVEAQTKLAELLAMLELDLNAGEAPQPLDQPSARNILQSARRHLQNASRQWKEARL